MKKNLLMIVSFLALGACIMPAAGTDATGATSAAAFKTQAATVAASANEKMQLCMLTEATNMLVDGSLLNQKVKASAKTISNTCAQKLAIQALPVEYQALAEAVVNNVKASRANKQ